MVGLFLIEVLFGSDVCCYELLEDALFGFIGGLRESLLSQLGHGCCEILLAQDLLRLVRDYLFEELLGLFFREAD